MTNGNAPMHVSKRSAVLAAAVAALAALAALALAPMASAASWGATGSTHVLDAGDVTFETNFNGLYTASATCTQSSLHTEVQSTARLAVTGASFTGCRGTGQAAGCTATVTAANLPWVVTAPTTTNVSIDNFRLIVTVGTTGSDYCFFNSEIVMTTTGVLSAGTWNQAQHQITWANPTGLTSDTHFLGTFPSTVRAAYRDTTQTLSLAD